MRKLLLVTSVSYQNLLKISMMNGFECTSAQERSRNLEGEDHGVVSYYSHCD